MGPTPSSTTFYTGISLLGVLIVVLCIFSSTSILSLDRVGSTPIILLLVGSTPFNISASTLVAPPFSNVFSTRATVVHFVISSINVTRGATAPPRTVVRTVMLSAGNDSTLLVPFISHIQAPTCSTNCLVLVSTSCVSGTASTCLISNVIGVTRFDVLVVILSLLALLFRAAAVVLRATSTSPRDILVGSPPSSSSFVLFLAPTCSPYMLTLVVILGALVALVLTSSAPCNSVVLVVTALVVLLSGRALNNFVSTVSMFVTMPSASF